MCKIDGCDNKAAAHGLCRKHYMRLRRNGDAETTKRRGREADSVAIACKKMDLGNEWSPRTRGKYQRAWRILNAVSEYDGKESDYMTETLPKYIRPNGTINVTGMLRHAQRLLDMRLMAALTEDL